MLRFEIALRTKIAAISYFSLEPSFGKPRLVSAAYLFLLLQRQNVVIWNLRFRNAAIYDFTLGIVDVFSAELAAKFSDLRLAI